jgi:hypothetical protein
VKLISRKFNFNSTLESIIQNKPDGVTRECLIDYENSDKDQQLINYSYDIENSINVKVFLSVKFPYGSRPKRIELVFFHQNFISICKFSNTKSVDQSSLELQSIISNYKSTTSNNKLLIGVIFFPKSNSKVMTKEFALNHLPDIHFADIKTIKSGDFIGLFNKSKSSS